jgi:hypothetical protein
MIMIRNLMIRNLAVAAFSLAAVSLASAQGTLYGVASFSNFGTQSLYAIDASTGAATLIGSTGLRQIAGLDYDDATGRLMALTVGGDQFSLNTSTGASTLSVDSNFSVPEGSITFAGGSAFTTLSDNLHNWNGAAWQQVGPSLLAPGADISGLDFGATQLLGLALNGAGADELVSFNLGTGAATVIGVTGTNASTVAGLTSTTLGGLWYMTDGSTLYSLNTATGSATSIGAHGVAGFSGLAFIPSPSSLLVLGIAGLASTRRRR